MESKNVPSELQPDRESRWLFPAIVALYLCVAFGQSALKLLWADELITFYIAQQPGWAGIWHALAAGADPNPPLIHVLVQASTAAFGAGGIAVRLPSILCGLLTIASMWSILRRWVSPYFAAAGVLAFMCTRGFDYTYDSRSYAPLMAFAMAALALWVALPAASGVRRWVRVAGLAACLGLGISSNYYGVLAFFPIAAGEIFRNHERRRVGWGVWLALLAGALPLLAYLPLIRHNIAEFAPHAWNRPHLSMVGLSYLELVEGVFWPVLLLGIFAVWKHRAFWPLALPETAALSTLLLYPVIGFGVALGGAGMVSPRCVVPVCCGFGLVLALLASHTFGENRRAQFGALALFLVWTLSREGFCAMQLLEQRRSFFVLRDHVALEPAGQILVGDSSFAFPLYYYSNQMVQNRICVPIDFERIHRVEQDDSGEQNLWAGREHVWPFPVMAFAQVDLREARPVVIGRPDGWLAVAVRAGGVSLIPDDGSWNSNWYSVGGIFSPMAHPETRIQVASRYSQGL